MIKGVLHISFPDGGNSHIQTTLSMDFDLNDFRTVLDQKSMEFMEQEFMITNINNLLMRQIEKAKLIEQQADYFSIFPKSTKIDPIKRFYLN